MAARPVFVDMDAGFDDMLAVEMVARAPGLDIVGLSLVAGNAGLPQVVENAARMAAFLGWRMPIHVGRDQPILGEPTDATNVLGATALPTTGRGLPPAAHAFAGDGVGALLAALERHDGLDILALGPATNLAIACLARPDLVRRAGRVVWMGGGVGVGNHTAAAEFNAAADPEAAAILFRAGLDVTMMPLDCCRQVMVTSADAAALRERGGERAAILADLLGGYVRIVAKDGSRPMALYDPVAAAALIAPDAFAFEPARVLVETGHGPARGATICEFRTDRAAPNARVARRADAVAVRALALGALEASATSGHIT
jgi:purine nucleosidase